MKLNADERVVLGALADIGSDFGYLSFAGILARSELKDRKRIRRACRSLARKGLAEYGRALWNDDGPAGSGYCATKAGEAIAHNGATE